MSSLAPLLLYSSKALRDTDFGFVSVESSDLAHARTTIVQEALKEGANWLLWLDADHTFPPDALVRLLAHDKAAIGANYKRRAAPYTATAIALDGQLLETNETTAGLVEVKSLGMGVLLVSGAALKKVGLPLFVGGAEDRFFCQRLRSAGFSIHVDQGLSREVGHIGEYEHHFTAPFSP